MSFTLSPLPAPTPRRNSRAFTLVELLVVIGIIALLISILLPSLNRAREVAKSVKCSANLKSIGNALQIYLQDNKQMCPIGYWDGTNNPNTGAPITTSTADRRKTNWGLLLLSAMTTGSSKLPTNAYEIGQLAAKGTLPPGPIQMFQCPSVRNSAITANNQIMIHYSAHPRVFAHLADGNTIDPATNARRTTMKASRIRRSSDIAAVFDASLVFDDAGRFYNHYDIPVAQGLDNGKFNGYGDGSNGATYLTENWKLASYSPPYNDQSVSMNGFYGNVDGRNIDEAAQPATYKNANNIRFRHSGDTVANVLLFDGHVESFKYNRNLGTTDLLRKAVNVSP